MRIFTFGDINTKIRADLDLQDTVSLPDTMMVGFVNDAIDECEAEIHKLNCEDDYFLAKKEVTLTAGTSAYPLSTMCPNIYGTRIKAFVYHNGSDIYDIKRLRGSNKFLQIQDILQSGSSDNMKYIITNDMTDRSTTTEDSTNDGALTLNLYPAPASSGALATLWYVRNAMRVPTTGYSTFKLDIPEFTSFIIAHAKQACLHHVGDPREATWEAKTEAERVRMIDTLTPMVPDNDDKIEMDMSHYEEMN